MTTLTCISLRRMRSRWFSLLAALLLLGGATAVGKAPAPRSDGRLLHVDFEHHVEKTRPILNAGVMWQPRVVTHIATDPKIAFAGAKCAHVPAGATGRSRSIQLQARFDAPRLRGIEIAEFMFRPTAAQSVEIADFAVWSPNQKGGVVLRAHGSAGEGTYRLDVHDKAGRKPGVSP